MTAAQAAEAVDSAEFTKWKAYFAQRAEEAYEAEHGPRPLGREDAMRRRAAKRAARAGAPRKVVK